MARTPILIVVTGTWLIAVAVGLFVVFAYSNKSGPAGSPPLKWPDDCPLPRSANSHTMLMFAHPRCPCTPASVMELAEIMAVCQDRVQTTVVFYCPAVGYWE